MKAAVLILVPFSEAIFRARDGSGILLRESRNFGKTAKDRADSPTRREAPKS